MLTKILLPHRYQLIGWMIFLPFVALLFAENYLRFSFSWLEFEMPREDGFLRNAKDNFTNELALTGVFISLFLIAFAREKEEDEFIQKLRFDSLLVACYMNTFILILGTLLFYSFGYLAFMAYNMFKIHLIFIARFRWVLYKQQKSMLAL